MLLSPPVLLLALAAGILNQPLAISADADWCEVFDFSRLRRGGCPVNIGVSRRCVCTMFARRAARPERERRLTAHDTMMVVRLVEAQYEDGVLRPVERLGLRSGERVSLIVVRRPDPRRWDLARLSSTSNQEDLSLSEQGLGAWASSLDASERS